MMTEAMKEHTDILGIDVVSYATSVGQAAAARLASIMAEGAANCWFTGGYDLPVEDGEAALQQLGAYVATRAELPGGEQLYRKAHELGLHAMAADGYGAAPEWLRTAYQVFAITTFTAAAQMNIAQDHARLAEEHARQRAAAAPAPVAASETAMEQHAGLADTIDELADGAAPSAAPQAAEAEGATPAPPSADAAPAASRRKK